MNPIILYANHYRFRAGERIRYRPVYSRMLVYGMSGRGTVRVNGTGHPLFPGSFLLLPWKHDIAYLPDDRDPFSVGAVHLVPDSDAPAIFRVPHDADDPLADSPERRDAPLPGITGLLAGEFETQPRLFHLAEYIVGLFTAARQPEASIPDERTARALASVLVQELSAAAADRYAPTDLPHPAWPALRDAVRDRLDEKLSVADIARAGAVSTATATRIFRRAAGMSPARYVQERRIEEAENLIRSTSLSLGEIGRRVGVENPYYFSRLFKRIRGVSPSLIRRTPTQI